MRALFAKIRIIDFPKKITYRLVGDKLKATISGNGKLSDYLFIKK